MNNKMPFDMTELFNMFQPQSMAKMFEAGKMPAMFDPSLFQGLDLQSITQSNQRNYAALAAANQAALTVYEAYTEMQQRVYQEVMHGAVESIQAISGDSPTEIAMKQSEIYAAAMEKSLSIMTELATVTEQASEEAYAVIQGRVEEAVEELVSA